MPRHPFRTGMVVERGNSSPGSSSERRDRFLRTVDDVVRADGALRVTPVFTDAAAFTANSDLPLTYPDLTWHRAAAIC